jgi:hypothetical protein
VKYFFVVPAEKTLLKHNKNLSFLIVYCVDVPAENHKLPCQCVALSLFTPGQIKA